MMINRICRWKRYNNLNHEPTVYFNIRLMSKVSDLDLVQMRWKCVVTAILTRLKILIEQLIFIGDSRKRRLLRQSCEIMVFMTVVNLVCDGIILNILLFDSMGNFLDSLSPVTNPAYGLSFKYDVKLCINCVVRKHTKIFWISKYRELVKLFLWVIGILC